MTDLEILRKKRTQVLLVWKTRLVIESYCVTLSITVHTGGPDKNDVWLVATQKKEFENT